MRETEFGHEISRNFGKLDNTEIGQKQDVGHSNLDKFNHTWTQKTGTLTKNSDDGRNIKNMDRT